MIYIIMCTLWNHLQHTVDIFLDNLKLRFPWVPQKMMVGNELWLDVTKLTGWIPNFPYPTNLDKFFISKCSDKYFEPTILYS